jgi:hypothetical protein
VRSGETTHRSLCRAQLARLAQQRSQRARGSLEARFFVELRLQLLKPRFHAQ